MAARYGDFVPVIRTEEKIGPVAASNRGSETHPGVVTRILLLGLPILLQHAHLGLVSPAEDIQKLVADLATADPCSNTFPRAEPCLVMPSVDESCFA